MSSNLQPSSENSNTKVDGADNLAPPKYGRGPTKIHKDWGTGKILHLQLNDKNQVVGDNYALFASLLGNIARDGNKLPLTCLDWRKMPKSNLERVWNDIKANTNLLDSYRMNCMKRLNKLWRDWKANVKALYFIPFKKDKDILGRCPDRVEEDQWPELIRQWKLKAVKKRSKKNKKNRRKQTMLHTSGRKGCAIIREELLAKNGVEPSNYDVFIAMRMKKNSQPVDDVAAKTIETLNMLREKLPEPLQEDNIEKDKILENVIGPEKFDRVRTFGLGSKPIGGYFNSGEISEEQQKVIDDAVDAKVTSIINTMMEKKNAEFEEKLAVLKNDIMVQWYNHMEAYPTTQSCMRGEPVPNQTQMEPLRKKRKRPNLN